MPASAKRAVILTALYEETRAVLRHLGSQTIEDVSGTRFLKGQFEGWEVVVAEIGAGNTAAAAVGTRALDHYKPEVALFVGVAGGVKDVAIGDVVVGTKVYGYETGKDTSSGFKPRPDLMRTAHDLEQIARILRQGEEWKKRLDRSIQHQHPRVFVDPIAAGEKVVASTRAATAKLIGEHYSDALAVEMEGRGFMEAVHINQPIRGAVVRGISDLLSGKADADKAGSKVVSADAASAVAFEMLSAIGGTEAQAKKPARKFIETPVTFSPSAYFKPREVLAKVGEPNRDELQFFFDGQPEAFLRIIPTEARDRPIPLATLNQLVGSATLLRGARGGSEFTDLNEYGAILYEPPAPRPRGPAPMHVATQLFDNGELWALSDVLLVREREWRPAWVPLPFVPALDLEQSFYRALQGNVAFATRDLGLAFPCTIELGLIVTAGQHLILRQDDLRTIRSGTASIVRGTLKSADPAAINELLLEFFEAVHDKTGYPRPGGLYGFPPGPPHG
jgi:nucleoside phosphorylase